MRKNNLALIIFPVEIHPQREKERERGGEGGRERERERGREREREGGEREGEREREEGERERGGEEGGGGGGVHMCPSAPKLRSKRQIRPSNSCSLSLLTPGQMIQALTQ